MLPPSLPPKPQSPAPQSQNVNLLAILQPLPLPKYLSALPGANLKELNESYELIKGYIKHLDSFSVLEGEQVKILENQMEQLDRIIQLIYRYDEIFDKTETQLSELHLAKRKWTDLELVQFNKLNKFNPNFLRNELAQSISHLKGYCIQLERSFKDKTGFDEREFSGFLDEYKNSRKLYHLRNERLNRWNEDRIGGLI